MIGSVCIVVRKCLAGVLLVLGMLSVPGGAALAEPLVEIKTISQEGFSAKFNPENEQRPGIMIEVFRAIERIDPGVKFVGYEAKGATARVEEELQTGEIDVFFGLAKTPLRATRYLYVEPPLYITRSILAARADDPVQIMGWDDVRALGEKGIVLVVRGTSHAQYLWTQGGLLIDDQAVTTPSNLRKLLAGRGRFFFGSDVNVAEEIETLKVATQVRILPVRFWETGIYAVFSKKASPAMVKRVGDAIRKLDRSGELKKIRARYLMD
ncbi:ABC-type amino acid transport substrate-binding protein [Formivibrio citricus]|uniref:ABC-type amino acid transport substrate-binding protein n=1 Tax=Formivibrio citricus TaxID=83765 RepID=A0A1I4Y957_9NEIS|nr:transporter substrate-binding domain-containing protein [Formivibrio citricus]SFN34608.1 ABC-type amino acid transport substrate-binding protein [Formivibrio citricus]